MGRTCLRVEEFDIRDEKSKGCCRVACRGNGKVPRWPISHGAEAMLRSELIFRLRGQRDQRYPRRQRRLRPVLFAILVGVPPGELLALLQEGLAEGPAEGAVEGRAVLARMVVLVGLRGVEEQAVPREQRHREGGARQGVLAAVLPQRRHHRRPPPLQGLAGVLRVQVLEADHGLELLLPALGQADRQPNGRGEVLHGGLELHDEERRLVEVHGL
mmetsp:Transcript_98732/g.307609  ORF Transcript_98732/g.307609 Transcript_98732/m.307609 type:complete len:215 (-) Transcript_98732:1697-2341(-)